MKDDIIYFSIMKKVYADYYDEFNIIIHYFVNEKFRDFNIWLYKKYGFYITRTHISGNSYIVVTDPNKKLLFDLKYPQ